MNAYERFHAELDFWKPNATTKYKCIYHIDSFLSQVVSSFWDRTDPAGKHGRKCWKKNRNLKSMWVDFRAFSRNFSRPQPWLVIGQVSLLKRLERFGFERWRIHSQKTRWDVGNNLKSCYLCEQFLKKSKHSCAEKSHFVASKKPRHISLAFTKLVASA